MNNKRKKLVKPRSSHSELDVKKNTRKTNKFIRKINAEVQPRTDVQYKVLKKRGVYVEKKVTDLPADYVGHTIIVPLSTKKVSTPHLSSPRSSRKRFEKPVLNSLSGSSSGSQRTNDSEEFRKIDKKKIQQKKKGNKKEMYEEWITKPYILNTKSRYKFKKSNNTVRSEFRPIIVIKSDEYINSQTSYSNTDIENELLETYEPKSKRISEISKKVESVIYMQKINMNDRNNDDIQNICINDKYNDDDDCENQTSDLPCSKLLGQLLSTNSSEYGLEMGSNQDLYKFDERFLQELNKMQRPSSTHSCSMKEILGNRHKIPQSAPVKRSHKLKSNSKDQHKTANQSHKTKTSKKTTSYYDENEVQVENFYGALKVIAKTKKRCHKLEGDEEPKRRREVLPTKSRRKQFNHYPKQYTNNPKASMSHPKKSTNCPKSRYRKQIRRKASYLSIGPKVPRAPTSAVQYYDTNSTESDTSAYITPSNFAFERIMHYKNKN